MSDKEYDIGKWIRKAATVMLRVVFIVAVMVLTPLSVRDIGKKMNERKGVPSADTYNSDVEYTTQETTTPEGSIHINKNVDKNVISDIKDKEEINYSITVTNTGDIPLRNVKFVYGEEDGKTKTKQTEYILKHVAGFLVIIFYAGIISYMYITKGKSDSYEK